VRISGREVLFGQAGVSPAAWDEPQELGAEAVPGVPQELGATAVLAVPADKNALATDVVAGKSGLEELGATVVRGVPADKNALAMDVVAGKSGLGPDATVVRGAPAEKNALAMDVVAGTSGLEPVASPSADGLPARDAIRTAGGFQARFEYQAPSVFLERVDLGSCCGVESLAYCGLHCRAALTRDSNLQVLPHCCHACRASSVLPLQVAAGGHRCFSRRTSDPCAQPECAAAGMM